MRHNKKKYKKPSVESIALDPNQSILSECRTPTGGRVAWLTGASQCWNAIATSPSTGGNCNIGYRGARTLFNSTSVTGYDSAGS